MAERQIQRDVHGILLLDKPKSLTSNSTLQRLKRLFQARKAGHSGTLDPLATGMLPICFGEATKFARFLLDADKTYEVTARLGISTDSGDADGKVIAVNKVGKLSTSQLHQVLTTFTGSIEQIPPMYSAIKYQGTPLYELARQGIEIEREPREVLIHEIKLLDFTNDELQLRVRCSKGTYIRALIMDIGKALGCGAHVLALHRVGVAGFEPTELVSMQALKAIKAKEGVMALDHQLLPITSGLSHLPSLKCTATAVTRLRQGQAIQSSKIMPQGWVQLLTENNQFFGVGALLANGRVIPRRLLAN